MKLMVHSSTGGKVIAQRFDLFGILISLTRGVNGVKKVQIVDMDFTR